MRHLHFAAPLLGLVLMACSGAPADGGDSSSTDSTANQSQEALSATALCGAQAGTWADTEPVTFTSQDPNTGAFTGTGSSNWAGSLTGTTQYSIGGKFTANGYGSGTIDEVFTGRDVRGRQGTLSFHETWTSDPLGNTSIHAVVKSGSGDFHGAIGQLTFKGVTDATGVGGGTFSGTIHY